MSQKKLALVTIHGMGDTKKDYNHNLVSAIRSEIGGAEWNKVALVSLYYQDILQKNQENIFANMREHIDYKKLRKFLLYGFSDAASLEHKKDEANSPYLKTNWHIFNELGKLHLNVGDIPIIIVAHSLGCQVISNYIWDAQKTKGIWDSNDIGDEKRNFLKMKSVRRLYTTGCNIPIFVAGHPSIEAIAPPNDDFEWHNFYDEDDVLGWPLQPLYSNDGSDNQEILQKLHDIAINADGGSFLGFLQSWTPLSHNGYWGDSQVVKPIAKGIRTILNQTGEQP